MPRFYRKFFASLFLFAPALSLYAFDVPAQYPEGELGRMVKLGETIAKETATHPLTKQYVGNNLNCVNCHLAGSSGKPGTTKSFGTWIGTASALPAYTGRERTIQTLQDRSDNCFMRSMNGKRLPIDSEASLALAAYITWLSTGMPVAMNAKRSCSPLISDQWAEAQERFAALLKKATHANYLSGQKIYANKCAMCHGTEGQGMDTMPPLWGKNADGKWLAYNAGGGMSKLNKAAAWVQVNMPFGQGGTLSDQEASDVMLFVDAQPRSGFDLKKALLRDAGEGIYNSDIRSEYDSVRSNFKLLGLDIDTVRGDKKIP